MAVDKLVDSTQLDADLTSIANAIRTKGGTSASLAFPAGFVSAVEAIETGGGSGGGTHNLPSGYTEYEYIEATGTQYINTGYVPNATTEIVMTLERTSVQSYSAYEFGVSTNPVTERLLMAGRYYACGNQADKTGSYDPDNCFGPMTIRVNTSGLYNILGIRAINPGTVTWADGIYPIYFFCINRYGTAGSFAKEKCYYFCANESGVKQIELIPAMRNSDSVLGFYDLVSDTFFTNAGTGTFTGGAFT